MSTIGGASLGTRHGNGGLPLTVLGQIGHRVTAGQFIRHGSGARSAPLPEAEITGSHKPSKQLNATCTQLRTSW